MTTGRPEPAAGPEPSDPAGALRAGLQAAGWSAAELCAAAAGVGGGLSEAHISGVLFGSCRPDPPDYDLLAMVVNAHLEEQGLFHRVPYWDDLALPI